MKSLRILLFALLIAAPFGGAFAQQSINRVISSIESDTRNPVEYVACNERRNPKNKKIYKSSKVIILKNSKQIEQVIAAIKKERVHSTSYEESSNKVFKIVFSNNSELLCYTLVKQRDNKAMLTVEIINDKYRPAGAETIPPTDEVDPMFFPTMFVDCDMVMWNGL